MCCRSLIIVYQLDIMVGVLNRTHWVMFLSEFMLICARSRWLSSLYFRAQILCLNFIKYYSSWQHITTQLSLLDDRFIIISTSSEALSQLDKDFLKNGTFPLLIGQMNSK